MHPIVHFFGRTLGTYGVMAGVGILLSFVYLFISLRKNKAKLDDAIYIYAFGVIGALVGAKLFFILTVWNDFIADLSLLGTEEGNVFVLKYISAGWVFYGGLLMGIAFAWLAARYFKTNLFYFTADLVPALIVFTAVGRIGCFMAGCCYGIEAHTPISVVFPPGGMAPAGVPLIPTQLIEAVCDLFILVIIVLYRKKVAERRIGILSLYLILYSVMRFSLEFLRGDVIRGSFLMFSTSQWVAIILLVAVILLNLFFPGLFKVIEKDNGRE